MKRRPLTAMLKLLALITIASMPLVGVQSNGEAAEPVKVGFLTSLSGVYAGPGTDLRDGFNLYMSEIKHKAGGRQIKVFVGDVGSNQVSLALDVARKLVDREHINILSGVVGSGSAYALAEFVEKHKLPFVIALAGADDLTQRKNNPYIVRSSFVNSSGSHPLGEWLYEKGYRKAVLMGADYSAGYEHAGGIAKAFKKKGGKVIQEIWPPLRTKDYAPYLAQINRDADVVMVFFAGADALRFVRQYADYGFQGKIPLVGKFSLVDDKILPKQGKAAEGIITESHWSLVLDSPENKKFRAAYIKKYGRPPAVYSELGYVAAMLIAETLNKTKGEVKGKEFVNVARSITLTAPRGTVKFDKYGAPVQTSYLCEVKKLKDSWRSVPIKNYPDVHQFWKWGGEKHMGSPPYSNMKGKWAE